MGNRMGQVTLAQSRGAVYIEAGTYGIICNGYGTAGRLGQDIAFADHEFIKGVTGMQ